MIDLMYFSTSAPLIVIERPMHLGALVAARSRHPNRPPWGAIFAKGFALVAKEFAALRQIYFGCPFPYFYEYEESTVSIACESKLEGEDCVLPVRIRGPEDMSLDAIRYKLVEIADPNLWQRKFYRTLATISGLPIFLRRPLWWIAMNVPRLRRHYLGTFAITSVANLGANMLMARSPYTSLVTYGVLADNGDVQVRLVFDHRVYDGATAARVLGRLEQVLLGVIHDEIKSQSSM